jgi:hypothetical protein
MAVSRGDKLSRDTYEKHELRTEYDKMVSPVKRQLASRPEK